MNFNVIVKPRKIILDVPILAFLGVYFLSVLFSIDKPASLFGSYGRWYDGSLALVSSLLIARILAEKLKIPRSIPFAEQGLKKWLLLGLPVFFLAGSLLFWNRPSFSYGTGFAVARDTLLENPKNFLLGSGPDTFFIDKARHGAFGTDATLPWIGEVIATTGILGAGFFISVWGAAVYGAVTLFQKRKDRILASFVFGMLGASIAALILLPMSMPSLLFSWGALVFSMALFKGERRYEFSLAVQKFFIPTVGFFFAVGILSGLFMAGAGEWWHRKAMANPGRIQYAENAVRFHPFEPAYRIGLSRAYLDIFLREFAQPVSLRDSDSLRENIQLASESARKATTLAPHRADAWSALGTVYKEILSAPGAPDAAALAFEKAVFLEPLNPNLHAKLGKIYADRDDFEKAKEQFQKASELDPFFAMASLEMALVLEKEGKSDEAIALMERVAIRFSDKFAFAQLGRMYYNTKRYRDAIAQFERSLSLKETDSNARYALALSYEAIGDTEKAILELEKVLQLNPDNEEVKQKLHTLQQKINSLKSLQ